MKQSQRPMRLLLMICVLASALAWNAGANGTNKVNQLSLADCFRLALEHNFDVRIERQNPRIAQFNLNAAYAPYDPTLSASAVDSFRSVPGSTDPTTGLTLPSRQTDTERFSTGLSGQIPTGMTYDLSGNLTRSSGTTFPADQYNADVGINIRQPLLRNMWIDATRHAIMVNRKTLKISELAFYLQVMNVLTRVELAYYDLIFAIENVKVQTSALELAERLLSENKKRVEVGALAPLDEKQSESQVAARKADLLSAQREVAAQQNNLKNLLTDDYLAWHQVFILPAESLTAIPGVLDVQDSWHKGMTQRPDLLQLQEDLERRNITLRFNFNQLFPSLDLTASFGLNGLDTTGSLGRALDGIGSAKDEFYSYGVIFSIPLSNRGARNRHAVSKAEVQQALLRLKKLEQDVVVQIDDAIKFAKTQFERTEATRQARLYAELALEAEQKKLASGKSTSFVVLQLQRDLTAARSAEIRALADYNKALAQLALNEGSTLERHNISVDIK